MTHVAEEIAPAKAGHEASTAAAIAHRLIAEINAAACESEPFEHIRFRNAFDPAVYAAMTESIPDDRYFIELRHGDAIRPDGTSSRTKMTLTPFIIGGLPADQRSLWMAIHDALCDPGVRDAFVRKFAGALTRRFGPEYGSVAIHPYIILTRDLAGYRITPHPDSGSKVITVQLYLPRDDTRSHIGTRFHDVDGDSKLTHAMTMPFAPKCGYAFPVAPDSWHSVEQINEAVAPRLSLLLIYYLGSNPVRRRLERVKGLGKDIQGRFIPLLRAARR